ncbi:hypothetical protein KC318_g1137 [Hortaea werneckii]|nr:hypothetical protein KC334_g1195 [Hortaea werneckii]KAI7004982.1 hypothetical protein KC355_g8437 [Hortaea werneckii]KAI7675147.1 hypothetical protein KC318_g1137 [Hortaea werneckii]RMY40747.1 hypothetical protein D0866_01052 [Hortaea werneckii]
MSQTVPPSAGHHYHIESSLDYGCHSNVIKVQVFDNGQLMTDIGFIQEHFATYTIPARAAYHDGAFYSGFDLQEHLNGSKHPVVPYENVIQFAKLALYEGPPGSAMKACIRRVNKQLAQQGKSLDEFLVDHLRDLINKAREQVRAHPLLHYLEAHDVQAIPWRLRMTVPLCWSPQACVRMQAAAKAAGIELTSLASEPECAVAASIDHLCGIQSLLPAPLPEQSRILSADLGCDTNDYTLVEVGDALAINTKLIVLKETSGPLGGSQRINERLLSVFEDSLGDEEAVEAEAMRLGLTLDAFRGHALDSIEVAKKLFPNDPFYAIHVIGTTGLQSSYVFTKAQLQDAYNVVVADVELNIDEYVNDPALKPDLIFVSGGFGKNRFLHERLVRRYHGTTVLTPCYYDPIYQEILVAAGALSPRYKQIFTQQIPARFSYAVLRDEEYDPTVHVDAWVLKNMKRIPKAGVIHPSGWNTKRRFVFKRMFPFLKKGETVTTTDIEIGVPMNYYMRVYKKLELKADFVLIDEEKLEPFMKTGSDTVRAFDGGLHGPAFEADEKTVRPGVKVWKKTVHTLKLSKDQLSSFNQVTDTVKRRWYEVPAQLRVKYRSERDMVMVWRLLPPHGQSIDVEETVSLLWDAEHSEFFENPVSDPEEGGEE